MWTTLIIVCLLLVALWGFGRYQKRMVEKLVPSTGNITPVDRGTIHWDVEGQGPPVVLIHGLTGQLRNFTYALSGLLADRYTVYSVDRPGSGYSKRDGAAQATLSEQARMIAEFLRAEGIEDPLLVGHSLGGAVSLQLALDYPDRVSGLALLAPLSQPQTDPPSEFAELAVRNEWLRWCLGTFLSVPIGRLTASHKMTQIFSPEPVAPNMLVKGGGALTLRPKGFIASSEDVAALEHDLPLLAARYDKLKLPIAILYGARDPLLEPSLHGAKTASQIEGVVYESLSEAGHMLPVTHPETCAQFIRDQDPR